MIRRPPRSTLFPTRRSSDLPQVGQFGLGGFERPFRVESGLFQFGIAQLDDDRIGLDRCSLQDVNPELEDRKSTRLNSSHQIISYAVFCLKKKKKASSQDCRA